MKIYLVGGAVRDELLKLPSPDRDWVVVGATPEDLSKQGFKAVGADFPVFLHPDTKEEYALARTERKSGKGYKGFTIHADKSVSLEEDLGRRDLTINAIAKDSQGEYIDPYGGIQDIEGRVLRHVSPAFREDPLRVLRVARFAARFHHLGFHIHPSTLTLMREIAASGELEHLVAERIWKELSRALMENSPSMFARSLIQCHALEHLIPQLQMFLAHADNSISDAGEHTLNRLDYLAKTGATLPLRFSGLFCDLGAPEKHNEAGKDTPDEPLPWKSRKTEIEKACSLVCATNECRELTLLCAQHYRSAQTVLAKSASDVLRLFKDADAFRRPERFKEMLVLAHADSALLGVDLNHVTQQEERESFLSTLSMILDNTAKVSAHKYIQQGRKGPEIGKAMDQERLQIILEALSHKI